MGYTVAWFALADTSVEETAKSLGYELGQPCGETIEERAIGQSGRWTIVYDRAPVLSDSELLALSVERSVIVHESVDDVMYSRTAQWDQRQLTWSALVNLSDKNLATTGLSTSTENELRSAYEQSPSGAYDHVAQLAQKVVGFRHDQVSIKGVQFRKLIDNRPKPASISDRTCQWLVGEGFEAKDSAADSKHDRLFRRHVDGDFWLIVSVMGDRQQTNESWCRVATGIHHDGAATVARAKAEFDDPQRAPLVNPFTMMRRTYMALSMPSQPVAVAGEIADTFGDLTRWLQSCFDVEADHCTEEGLFRLCISEWVLNFEAAVGWSDRSESYLEQAKFLDSLNFRRNADRPDPFAFYETFRPPQRVIERFLVNAGTLRSQIDSDSPMSGPELAGLQREAGAPDALVESLHFEHWALVFSFDEAPPELLSHIVGHHLRPDDAAVIAGNFGSLPATVQLKFAEHERAEVAQQLSTNPTLDPTAQVRLAERGTVPDGSSGPETGAGQRLLTELARNPSLVPELQRAMAASHDSSVREALASNPLVLPELVEQLVKDPIGTVRSHAASNPRLDEFVQIALASQRSMAASLGRNPNLVESVQRLLVEQGELAAVAAIARNPGLADDLMHRLATSEETSDRSNVAGNPSLTRVLQERLAADEEWSVRDAIACSFGTHPDIRVGLQADKHERVSENAKRRAAELGEQPNSD